MLQPYILSRLRRGSEAGGYSGWINQTVLPLLARYGAAVRAASGIWTFQDAPGAASVADALGNYPGSPSVSGLTLGQAGPQVAGKQALAGAFDGVNGAVTFATEPTVATGTAFTLVALAKPTDLTTNLYPHIATIKTSNGTVPFGFALSNDASYRGVLFGTPAGTFAPFKTGTVGTEFIGRWRLISVVYNGGTASDAASFAVYLDGAPLAISSAGVFAALTNTSVIGKPASGVSNKFYGSLALLMKIGAALGASEIAELYGSMQR